MKLQSKATSILERTSLLLSKGGLMERPAWFKAVGAYPPMNDYTRKPKLFQNQLQRNDPGELIRNKKGGEKSFFKTKASKHEHLHRNNKVSQIPQLKFMEDELRDVFYHQHPWEFSRPKNLVENNEADENSKCDWSRMLQLYKPLDGESVVQRTLWLSRNEKLDIFDAYDKARFEFYRLRMEEEMNSAVSREESSMYGSIYTTTHNQWGIQQEQEVIDAWVKLGSKKTKVLEARRGGQDASSGKQEDVVNETSVWEAPVEKE